MMEEGEKEKFDEQFSLLDARARKRRRTSLVATGALTLVTGLLVLRLAADIVEKQMQVQRIEASRGELDQQLKTEQEKFDSAVRAREKLEAEIKDLEATKKNYQNRILSEKDAQNMAGAAASTNGKYPAVTATVPETEAIHPNGHDTPEVSDAPSDTVPLLIEELGKAPAGFSVRPNVEITPAIGSSGREIFKVHVWLQIPEGKRGEVERVTYHLSPKFYLKNAIDGSSAPTFEANFNVFACESTVLARMHLRDGATLAVDFDWCHADGWPARRKEPVIIPTEDEKTQTSQIVPQQTRPVITHPSQSPGRPPKGSFP